MVWNWAYNASTILKCQDILNYNAQNYASIPTKRILEHTHKRLFFVTLAGVRPACVCVHVFPSPPFLFRAGSSSYSTHMRYGRELQHLLECDQPSCTSGCEARVFGLS